MSFSRPPRVSRPAAQGSRVARRRRQCISSLTGSVVFHVVAFVWVFGSSSGDLISHGGAPGSEGPIISVSLVRPAHTVSARSDAGGELAPLFAKYRAAPEAKPIPMSTGPRSDRFANLFARLVNRAPSEVAQHDRDDSEARARPADATPSAAPSQSVSGQEAAGGDPNAGSVSTGALWGRIEPCWRKSAGAAPVPVTLEVAIDARGQLSKPPRILRGENARLDELRLASEARALAALSACLPRGDLRFAGAVYRLEFQPTR